ncbi:MAG: pseudouridine synthase [Bacteroidales bacterium]|nr:pseudouridine synthase [Bacteroidales bacterium]
MRNNQSQSRTGAGASGRRTPSRAGAGRSAGAERSGRRDSKPFDGERREARPVGRPRKDSKPFAGEHKDEKQFRRPRREIKPFGGENIEGERTFRGPRREGVNEGSYSRTPREGGNERKFSRTPREGGEERSFSRPRREGGEERSFSRPRREGGNERSFSRAPREGGEERSFSRPRREGGEERSFSRPRREGGNERSFSRTPREGGEERSFSRPRREGGEERSFSRPRREGGNERSFSRTPREGGNDRKFSRTPREGGEERSFSRPRREGGNERSFSRTPREGGSERSFSRTPREGGSERSFSRPRRDSFGSDGPKRIVKSRSTKPKAKSDDGMVRLNKFISNSGVCSRREADEYIVAGLVSVNGEVITELGTKIKQDSDVRFNGERLKGEEKVYILMNKPKDFVTTVSDPNADKTVMDLIAGKCSQRVYPVGRLDKQTTGVLLLTNDGEMADNLTHPSNMHKKIYHIVLDKNLSGSDFNAILEGITLDDGPVHADSLAYVDGEKSEVGLEIHSGRNRVVRRIFEHLGYKVKRLDRVFFAGLTKKNLRRGQWRFLTELEISMLKMGAYE